MIKKYEIPLIPDMTFDLIPLWGACGLKLLYQEILLMNKSLSAVGNLSISRTPFELRHELCNYADYSGISFQVDRLLNSHENVMTFPVLFVKCIQH